MKTPVVVCRWGAAAALAFGLVTQAWSHAHLDTATPPAGATLAKAPAELRLHFSEGVEPRFTGLTMAHADGSPVATGPSRFDAADPGLMTVPVTGRLGPGSYAVEWHALAADGHRTQGRFVFTVAP